MSDIEGEGGHKKSEHEGERVSRLDVFDHREINAVRFGCGVYIHGVRPVGNQPASIESNPFAAVLFAMEANHSIAGAGSGRRREPAFLTSAALS